MRCRACDRPIEESTPLFYNPEGTDLLVLETLCAKCLYIIRADLYDGGPDNEIETLTHSVGIDFHEAFSKD